MGFFDFLKGPDINQGVKEYSTTDDAVLLDVRTPDEYAAGHIPGSLLIPFDEIKVKSDQLPQNKNTEIVVYCRSGRRSAIAADTLISLGYAKIYDLGAVSSWTYGLEK